MTALPIPMATPKQIGFIHGLAGRAGMDEAMRRDFMACEAGVRSAKDLTAAQAAQLIDKLRALAGPATTARGAIAGLDSPHAKKLRALWIAGRDLGVVRDRTDKAMLAFLERQTGASHTRFLSEPGMAAKAIEALKGWLAREAGVAWPKPADDATEHKRAVLNAQWMRLIALGAVRPFTEHQPLGELPQYAFKVAGKNGWCFFSPADYDLVQVALGRKLRAVLADRHSRRQAVGGAR